MKLDARTTGAAVDRPDPDRRFYLFHGPDESGSRALAQRLLTALGAEKFAVAASGIKEDPASLSDEAGAMALFGGPRAIWIEPAGDAGHALRFAVWESTRWSAPHTVASGSDWFVNWADFPAVTALDDGTLVAHWLERTGGSPYAYGVRLAFSRDRGVSWTDPRSPHDDSLTEHGFVSKVPLPGGRLAAIWLDGRETAGAGKVHQHVCGSQLREPLGKTGLGPDERDADARR